MSFFYKKKGKVISLLNQKGGVGKTTMAFNLAYALKEKGHKVLCIDLDPQANLTLLFHQEEVEYNIFHLMINNVKELRALHNPVLLSESLISKDGVDLLPSGNDLSGFDLIVSGISAPRQLILNKFIKSTGLKEMYDYIIIDGPPTLGLLVVNILCACDGVLVPFMPDQFSQRGIMNFNDVIEQVDDMGIVDAPKVLGYIPNLVEDRRKQTHINMAAIKKDLYVEGDESKVKIFEGFPNRALMFKSQANRKSVFNYNSKDYVTLQGMFNKIANVVEEGLGS